MTSVSMILILIVLGFAAILIVTYKLKRQWVVLARSASSTGVATSMGLPEIVVAASASVARDIFFMVKGILAVGLLV